MKSTHALLALVTALALGSTAFAASAEAPATRSTRLVKPVVTKIVNPTRLPRSFKRDVVNVRFALDRNGQPQDIEILSRTARDVKKQIVAAFKEWRFEVAALGDVDAKRFVLPLDVVPEV